MTQQNGSFLWVQIARHKKITSSHCEIKYALMSQRENYDWKYFWVAEDAVLWLTLAWKMLFLPKKTDIENKLVGYLAWFSWDLPDFFYFLAGIRLRPLKFFPKNTIPFRYSRSNFRKNWLTISEKANGVGANLVLVIFSSLCPHLLITILVQTFSV